MEDLNYPNARDCQHGQLRRQCPHCEYDRDMAEAHEKIDQLQRQNDELRNRIGNLYLNILHINEYWNGTFTEQAMLEALNHIVDYTGDILDESIDRQLSNGSNENVL